MYRWIARVRFPDVIASGRPQHSANVDRTMGSHTRQQHSKTVLGSTCRRIFRTVSGPAANGIRLVTGAHLIRSTRVRWKLNSFSLLIVSIARLSLRTPCTTLVCVHSNISRFQCLREDERRYVFIGSRYLYMFMRTLYGVHVSLSELSMYNNFSL